MEKVIMICGKICSGKTHYADRLRGQMRAVVLSVDEIMLALFKEDLGGEHDKYAKRTMDYIFEKSLELIDTGISVILDCGFWSRSIRDYSRDFYGSRGIPYELHYLEVSKEIQLENAEKRNTEVERQRVSAYYVDEGLLKKCEEGFEKPTADEIDVYV